MMLVKPLLPQMLRSFLRLLLRTRIQVPVRLLQRLQPVQPELGHQPPSLQIVMMFVSVPVRPYAGGALLTRSSSPVLPLEMTQELI